MSLSSPSQWLKSPYLWLGATAIAAFFVFRGGDSTPRPRVKAPLSAAGSQRIDESRSDRSAAGRGASRDGSTPPREGLAFHSRVDIEPATVTVGDGPREIRGWVKDMAGAPVMGTSVRLATIAGPEDEVATDESEGGPAEVSGTWSLMTNADGAFVFEGSPVAHMRLTATGPDGTVAAAVVPWDFAGTTEVILTLEATATIIVNVDDPRLQDARVIIRTSDFRAHGAGAPPQLSPAEIESLRFDDISNDEEEVALDDIHAGDNTDDGVEPGHDEDPETAEGPFEPVESHDAQVARVVAAVQMPLLQWDPDDEEGSMARVFEGVFRGVPELSAMMAMELEDDPELNGSQEPGALGLAMAKMAMKREPVMGAAMGFIARRLKMEPERGLLALMEDPGFEQEMKAFVEAQEEQYPHEVVDEEEIAVDAVMEPASADPGLELAEPAEVWVGPAEEERQALALEWGNLATLLAPIGSVHEEDASGHVGEPIAVRTGFQYHVSIAIDAEHHELSCGAVTLGAGETLEWVCGREQEGALVGVVVDFGGRPVAAAAVTLLSVETGEELAEVLSDTGGRFELKTSSKRAEPVRVMARATLDPDRPIDALFVEMANVSLLPGGVQDVGRLVMAAPTQRADLEYDGSEFGDERSAFSDGGDSVIIGELPGDHPLASLGAEYGDRLLRLGDQDATRMSYTSAMLLLQDRGPFANGPSVAGQELVLRRASGEVYSVVMPAMN